MLQLQSKRLRVASACGDGEERKVATARLSTPIGEMVACVCSVGLHMIYQKDEITDENFVPDERSFPMDKGMLELVDLENELFGVPSNDVGCFPSYCRIQVSILSTPPQDETIKLRLDECLDWLISYFHNIQNVFQHIPSLCPISLGSTLFRDRVLMSLAKSVPVGKTITYGELASLAGSPGAQQAVGTAMAANPFQLIVPCHRVVKSGQKVGKYSGGCRNSVKIWLLQHEGLNVNEQGTVSFQ